MSISNYDKHDYDYSTYWKNRNFEHLAEVNILSKLLSQNSGDYFLDIGGSFGRHAPIYSKQFRHPIIVDYSLKTLQKNVKRLKKKFPNIEVVAADIYKLPFRENLFDGALMIRVLHHINLPEAYYKELSTRMANNAVYIQEFANKIHIKARLKHLLKGDFKFFNQIPYQQPTANNFEGSNGEEAIFLNFHPKHIKRLLKKAGFNIESQKGSSYLRIPFLKKVIPEKILYNIEKLLQTTLSWTYLSPSLYFKSTFNSEKKKETFENLKGILICPKCEKDMIFKASTATCKKCLSTYKKKKGVWDFRV